ncbi:MAG: DUF342 domain-containing protein [Chitinivibrionales bacterium]|nr:DUF342 domain-containing protein [Chitinivibrionales bacterium]
MTDASTKDKISCSIAEDKMLARLSIEEPGEERDKIAPQDILDELERTGIVYSIDKDIIKIAVDFYNEYGQGESDAVVAKGTVPVNGKDGRIECLVDFSKPVVTFLKDKKKEYKETDRMPAVAKGAPVFRIVPPTKAVDGMTVTGEKIPAVRGKWKHSPKIDNTEVSKEDPKILLAAIDGCAVWYSGRFALFPCRVIKGNVDNTTGNISFEGVVKVLGDIKSGYTVEAKAGIAVHGNIEDAHLKTEGDVTVKGGFNGTGKGTIECSGKVEVGYVRNQSVTAMGSIFIGGESIGARLYSRNKIIVRRKDVVLAGGSCYALQGIECASLGAESEITTEVSVGLDPAVRKKIELFNAKISELRTRSNYYAGQLEEIEKSKKKSKGLFQKFIGKMETVMEAKMNLDMQLDELEKKRNVFVSHYTTNEPSTLKVFESCYPGVVLSFSGFSRSIEKTVTNREFYLDKGDVVDVMINRK